VYYVRGTCDILMRLSAMQHPQPKDVYPEFPPQPQSFHPHSRDFRQQEMITGRPVDPRSLQPGDRSMNASAARGPYSIPITMDQRHLANSASALSQHRPPYLGSAPGPLIGIAHLPYFPTAGFAQGNNYIGVLNIESPTHDKQRKKRKRDGGTSPSRKRKGEYTVTYCARMCTDQFHAHVSAIVGFTKSSLSPCSSWENSASQWHAMWCWTPYFRNNTSKFIRRPRTH